MYNYYRLIYTYIFLLKNLETLFPILYYVRNMDRIRIRDSFQCKIKF